MQIYRNEVVDGIQQYFGDLFTAWEHFPLVADHLAAIAEKLREGLRSGPEVLYHQISNYHPGYLGKPLAHLRRITLKEADCRLAVAREYGYADWATLVREGKVPYQLKFEQAVQKLLTGDEEGLAILLEEDPSLAQARSVYSHRATLLHYTASNGVELWRQQVPVNLPAITRLLLEKGALKSAKMHVYGGHFDTFALLKTSGHPYAAGVGMEMEMVLGK